ncbi:hypothetical protein [Vibrio vulnificus]|uniref:hypothetical protein n=1 Tax=Vibrio vulnificus TaxID=672 RepID=UPI0015872FA4|nr:hypothetical protein [Vibrio vulnificus]
MKPRGTNNAVENGLTTQKNAFLPIISQCGGSTKSLKPRGTQTTKENVISASKLAFATANSQSRISAIILGSVNLKPAAPKKNQLIKRYQFWILAKRVSIELESLPYHFRFELLP